MKNKAIKQGYKFNCTNNSNMNNDLKLKLADANRRQAIDTKYAIHSVGHKKWDIISKKIGDDIVLWRDLYEMGQKNLRQTNSDTNTGYMYCGKEIYELIRPELVNAKIIYNESVKNEKPIANKGNEKKGNEKKGNVKTGGKGKPGSKKNKVNRADIIRQENIMNKIRDDLDSIIKSNNSDHVGNQFMFNARFSELILVKMMVHCRNLILKLEIATTQYNTKSSSRYTPPNELTSLQQVIDTIKDKLTELIIGYNKIILEKKSNPQIAVACIEDLSNWVNQAKNIIDFNAVDIIINKPELIFKTAYDGMLEIKQACMYPSQNEIFDFVTTNKKYLALVHTMLGSGKTSMVLPICGWLMSTRAQVDTKLIFCCPNEVVLLEVAHMVYGLGIPFGIIIQNSTEKYLEYKWSSFVDKSNPQRSSVLYLCDIHVTRILLEERMKCQENRAAYFEANKRDPSRHPLISQRIPTVPDYILMGDELTKDADSQTGFMVDSNFSITTETFVEIMKIAPPKIILMSATLPTAEQLPEFYGAINKNHPDLIIKSFSSSEAKIGCALISHSGELYAPHYGCQTVDEIKHILSVIQTNPFVGRFYTFEVLLQMIDIFKKLELEIPDLSHMFDDPSKATQTNIQKIAYTMLHHLILLEDDDIAINACSNKKIADLGVDLNTIFTSDSNRFDKGCLVFSSDPVYTAYTVYRANFDNFIPNSDNSNRNIFQQIRLDTILSKYEKEVDAFKKAIQRIENKKDDGAKKQNKENNTKERIKTETWEQTAKMLDQVPVWDFPQVFQICSPAHLEKVCHSTSSSMIATVGPDDLPKDSSVSTDILTMLASGIGIYSTESPELDSSYLNTVLQLAKKGLVKTIFADSSIAYGTNLAVSNIIMIDEPINTTTKQVESIVDKHSMKTIFQMLGRAGRGGNLSYQAKIYTVSPDNKLINSINAYTRGTLDEGRKNEIENIKRAFEILW